MSKRVAWLPVLFLCVLAAVPASAQIFFDDFEDGDISDWIIGETGTPGEMVLRTDSTGFAHSGVWAVYASCDNGGGNDHEIYMQKAVPCAGQDVYIVVWMRQGTVGPFEGSDYFEIGYRLDPSQPWVNARWSGDLHDTYRRYVVAVGPGTDTFEFRILFNCSAADEDWYIDDVAILGPPNGSVTRALPPDGTFTVNTPVPVTLTAAPEVGGNLVVTEVAPLPPTNVVASAGTANVNGTTITWTVTVGATTETLTYEVVPPDVCDPKQYIWTGFYDAGPGWENMTIAGDTSLSRTSDGWENDDVPWAGDIDIPEGLSPAGHTDYFACDDSFLVWGDGSDIWDTADEFHMLYVYVVGDFNITARVEQLDPSVNSWEKAGVMVRANKTPGSPHVQCIICSTCRDSEPHIVAQERVDQDGSSQRFDGRGDGTDPSIHSRIPNTGDAVVSVARIGTTIAVGADNLTETSWPQYSLFPWYAADRPNIPTNTPVLVGLVYTSHASGTMDRARFTDVAITGNVIVPAVKAATRDIQAAAFAPGQPVPVVITIEHKADSAPLTVTEVVPAGWTVGATTPTANVNGTTITWTLASFTGDTQVEYEVTPSGAQTRWPEAFSGFTTDQYGLTETIGGESTIAPAGVTIFQDGVYPDPSYAGCADTYIIMHGTGNPPYGDRNQGGYVYLEEGDWCGIENFWGEARTAPGFDDNKLILIKFDLSSIPRDAVVTDAWLRLYYMFQRRPLGDPPVGQLIDHSTWVHMIQREWGEGTGGGPDGRAAMTGEASWMSARTGIEDWETSGCRGLTDISPPTTYQAQSEQTYGTQTGVWVEYHITDFVRQWVRVPGANHGMKISQDDTGYHTSGYHFGAYNFASSDNPNVTLRPMLSVTYEEVPSLDARHWSLYR